MAWWFLRKQKGYQKLKNLSLFKGLSPPESYSQKHGHLYMSWQTYQIFHTYIHETGKASPYPTHQSKSTGRWRQLLSPFWSPAPTAKSSNNNHILEQEAQGNLVREITLFCGNHAQNRKMVLAQGGLSTFSLIANTFGNNDPFAAAKHKKTIHLLSQTQKQRQTNTILTFLCSLFRIQENLSETTICSANMPSLPFLSNRCWKR